MRFDLFWSDALACGYYPVDPADWPYDAQYFAKYQTYAQSDLGKKISTFRADLTEAHAKAGDIILDVGVGCGAFLLEMKTRRPRIWGYDVNPAAVEWLKGNGMFLAPDGRPDVMTFWDSFEHIPHPDKVIEHARHCVIMSIPIFWDAAHARRSKHFRTDEHFWYFTTDGLVRFMRGCGFRLEQIEHAETRLGREDIETFVFKRV